MEQTPFSTASQLESPTGARLAWYGIRASGVARGILLISHGLAEHARRYARFAGAMAEQGFHVYAHDHRGHGATTAPDAPLGRFGAGNGRAQVIADVMAMRDMALARDPGLPVILLGHSMGGLIALNVAEAHPQAFDALAVWNSNFDPGISGRAAMMILRIEQALKGSDVPSAILPKATFDAWGRAIPNHRTLFDWLSSDPVEVDAYIADPLCGFAASVSMWRDVLGFALAGGQAASIARLPKALPVYLVGGSDDPSTRSGAAMTWLEARLRSAGLGDVTTTIYPATRHETLNDRVRERATAEFAAWCRRVTAGRPS